MPIRCNESARMFACFGDSKATIVTGAFESPKQANILADSLQRIGITPVLIYRTGRAF